ncbi:isoamyl acetate-hydrolyzing esterase [Batrachochytrium dendrobatidis]|nr:isoamyl acetate-hydrolyzing esterase [Batrachochytrium dendrobatidis]
MQQDKILLLGDSLTQRAFVPQQLGWGAQLANTYIRKLDVINRGFSGYTTAWYKDILPSILAAETSVIAVHSTNTSIQKSSSNIQLATVLLGSNDASCPNLCPTQHVPLETYKANLDAILTTIQETTPCTRIVLMTPPPVHDSKWKAERQARAMHQDRSLIAVRPYRNACIELAKKHPRVALLDLWTVFLGHDADKLVDQILLHSSNPKHHSDSNETSSLSDCLLGPLFDDGLHFDTLGNCKVYDALLALVLLKWPELDPYTMPPLLPFWDQIKKSDSKPFEKWIK